MKTLWDKFTDIFSKTLIHPQYFLKQYEYLAIIELKKRAKGIFVDIGCGRQIYKKELINNVKRYIGVDHPDTSKKYLNKEMPDVFADALSLPFKDKFCDTAAMISVLEHIPKPDKAISEAYRILKSNGVLVLITVQNYPLHDQPYDYFRFTRFGLKELLLQNKFKILKLQPLGSFPTYAGQLLNVYLMNQLKKGFGGNLLSKCLSIILLPWVITVCLASNLVSYIFTGIFEDYDKGAFAIYNLVVAQKKSR